MKGEERLYFMLRTCSVGVIVLRIEEETGIYRDLSEGKRNFWTGYGGKYLSKEDEQKGNNAEKKLKWKK